MFSSAPCVTAPDPDLWFSDSPKRREQAKRMCAGCPVVAECAELGKGAEYGIFGGLTAVERAGITAQGQADERAARDAEIVRLRLGGATYSDIARRLGMAHSSVAFVARGLPELVEYEARVAEAKDQARLQRLELARKVAAMRDEGHDDLAIARALRLKRGVFEVERLLQKVS